MLKYYGITKRLLNHKFIRLGLFNNYLKIQRITYNKKSVHQWICDVYQEEISSVAWISHEKFDQRFPKWASNLERISIKILFSIALNV